MIGAFVTYLGGLLNASDSSIRLLLSLLSGYPLAMLYRSPLLYYQPVAVKHVYFIVTGFALGFFNFEWDIFHSLFNIVVTFVVLRIAGGTKASVAFTFIFNTMYLVIGYYTENLEQEYRISWTMPHCVLTLRLIAVAFDLYDGQKRPIPPEAKESALSQCPSLLELLAQCYCHGGFLVGPQFCMRRYLNFVHGEYSDPKTKGPPNSQWAAFERFAMGVFYIIVFQAIRHFVVSDEYIQSTAFQERGLLFKCFMLMIWGKNFLYKYILSWLLCEGAIIYCGLSYNGLDNNNVALWDACTNARVRQLETGCTLQHAIQSFNCNTNLWMAKYVFKRLRFLGNKLLSQAITLFYLALWHGLESGYYVNFFLELVYTFCERGIADVVERIEPLRQLATEPWLQPVIYVMKKIFSWFLISWALVSFGLLHWQKWNNVYASLHYVGIIVPVLLIALCSLLMRVLPPKSAQNGVAPSSSKSRSSAKTE